MNQNVRSGAMCLKSFYAASKAGDPVEHPLVLTVASAVGLLLHIGVTPSGALELAGQMPSDPTWTAAKDDLRDLVNAETRDTEPPMSAAGGMR